MPRRKQHDPQRTTDEKQNSVIADNQCINSAASTSRTSYGIHSDFSNNHELFGDSHNIDFSSERLECVVNNSSVSSIDSHFLDSSGTEGPSISTKNSTDHDSEILLGRKRKTNRSSPKGKKRRNDNVSDPCLQDFLDHCDFYLTICNALDSRTLDNVNIPQHRLGSIKMSSLSKSLSLTKLQNVPVVYLYVSPIPEKCILYFESSDEVFYCQVSCSASYSAMNSIKNKRIFSLFLMRVCSENNFEFIINVHIEMSGFHILGHQSDITQNLNMLSAIESFLDVSVPECPASPSKPTWPHRTTQELYDNVRELHLQLSRKEEPEVLPLSDLLPCLRPYQQDAVQWMLSREKGHVTQDVIHPLFMELQLPSSQIIYFNKYSGIVCLQKPLKIASPLGGILADEMGLGKTVEVLACILAHPRPTQSTAVASTLCVSETGVVVEASHLQTECNTNHLDTGSGCSSLDTTNAVTQIKENGSTSDLLLLSCGQKSKEDEKQDFKDNMVFLNSATVNNTCESLRSLNNSSGNISIVDVPPSIPELEVEADSTDEQHSDSGTEVMSDYEPEEQVVCVATDRRTRSNKVLRGRDEEDDDDDDDYVEDVGIDFTDENLECLCGQNHWDWEWVQCTHCGSWQHKFCMGFEHDMDESKYLCPHCWVGTETPLVPSRATLVVTPSSIRSQWEEEVQRHVKPDSLKWTFYSGVAHRNKKFMQPERLADYDLILVTYETLRKEIDYVDLPHNNSDTSRRFRNPKRFMATPTPLLAVQWWRVCLDEAQMVEGVTTKTAEMALRLTAVNRWCVTGTPIQKSVNDLYGLLLFLGEDPYWQKPWWKRLLYEPYRAGISKPLLNALSECFWRNSKKDVIHQIGLPPQIEVTYSLLFSPVETHFYKMQYQECSAEALRCLNKFSNLSIKLKELDKQTMAQLMWPLGRLRQACCHPQAVRGHLIPLQKKTITMEELLTSLIKKTKLECEDFHRQFICALNGLAGIHIINEDLCQAVEKYREVLQSVKEQKDLLKTDKIQQFHTLHNLSQLLKDQLWKSEKGINTSNSVSCFNRDNENQDSITINVPAHVGRTLEDDTLHEKSEELRSLYLEKCQAQVSAAQTQLTKASQSMQDIRAQFQYEGENWWIVGCKLVMKLKTDEALVSKVKDALVNKSKSSLSSRFSTLNGLMFMITKLLDSLKESHKMLAEAVSSLSATPTQEDVNSAITCHLRPLVTTIERCVYCQCHELFNHYEGMLFNFESGFDKDPLTSEEALWGQTRKGTWADSELECTLKVVLSFLKSNKVVNSAIIENGSLHLKLFEAQKKEFRCLRGVWMQIRDHASALDELEMAKIRLRLRHPDEPKPEIPLPYILEPEEVQPMKLKMTADRAVAENELRKKLGQLFYLQNLAKADFGRKGGSNPEPCPICQKMLGTEWSVLQCGHCFCGECIRILIVEYSVGFRSRSIRCAVCRQITLHADISYVNTNPESNSLSEEGSIIKGSHSTKVEAVIRCLQKIKKKEPEAKSLVFSTWQLVLNVIEEALTENDISCVTLQSHNLRKSLWQFKHNPEVKVLLLPVHSGANGLNLIEATHVLLVEPLLNPAAEVQALGRVHRIGQNKPTTVHRFIVSSTIEQRIHEACASNSSDKDEGMSLEELKHLFEK